MGRKKNVIAPEAQAMDLVAQDQKKQQITAVQAFKIYGFKDVSNYDLLVYSQKINLFLQLANRSVIEAGKGLIVIKAQEPHGIWLKTLEQIGIPERTARRYMHVARRFGKTANLAVLPTAKLEALEELDDPTLEKLDAGEDVLGLSLKGIDVMPASEVRKKAIDLEAKLAAEKDRHNKDIKEMSAELEVLRLRATGQEPPTKEQLAQGILDPLKKKLFEHLLEAQFHLDEAVSVVAAAQKVEGATFPQLQEWAKTHYEQLAPIGDFFEELDQALVNCGPDRKD
jgi:hypothetical protein